MEATTLDLDAAAEVLDFARARRAAADRAEADLLEAAVAWAGMHSTDSLDEAALAWDAHFGDTELARARRW